MNRIVDVLMERDGMTKSEAIEQKNEVRELVMEAIEAGDFDEVEDIMSQELGLEMDYIDDLGLI